MFSFTNAHGFRVCTSIPYIVITITIHLLTRAAADAKSGFHILGSRFVTNDVFNSAVAPNGGVNLSLNDIGGKSERSGCGLNMILGGHLQIYDRLGIDGFGKCVVAISPFHSSRMCSLSTTFQYYRFWVRISEELQLWNFHDGDEAHVWIFSRCMCDLLCKASFQKFPQKLFLCRRSSDLTNALGSSIFSSHDMNFYEVFFYAVFFLG